ncbi:calcium permeable stress-gated cation channel [Geosmithia morbida]|uniref:Calcium permeable stress-gated cation channel n=1 Tax=Geosmithia morbida TaxID=1094350 RepID=A0A9P4YXT5_9HYPO|nr:calcium permeable stress-gated cation channel [Geosmithia morbida]KAF4122984.1 calcium permeable stress-gated cation channel [Geosmithia morbida]
MGSFVSWIKTNMGGSSSDSSSDSDSSPQSLSGMISTLVPVLVISGVYLLFFLIFRSSRRRFYAPRSYLGALHQSERSPELPKGIFAWIGSFWKIPDVYALQHQSLDAYLFLRFLRVCTVIMFVSLLITWVVLFPVNATGHNGKSQLEILSYSNINIDTEKNRFYAHALVAWAVYGFMMYMITRECIFFINIRQAYLLLPQYAKRISSRTVLFTNVPDDYLDERHVRRVFGDNLVQNVWIPGITKDLDKLVEERDKVAMKLENGEIKLLKTVNKERTKASKKSGAQPASSHEDAEHGSLASRWIPAKKWPTHRTGFLGLIGPKVQTIDWCRQQLQKLVPETEQAQSDFMAGNYKKHTSIFVEFYTQADAQAAYQTITHHQPLHMAPKYIGVRPDEVIWKNLSIPWWQLIVRRYAVYFLIAVLIIFWAIPVGIVGIIAQVNTLKKLPGLTWIDDIPSVILGVVSGLLPSVALSILMSLVPVFMRMFASLSGEVSLARVELFCQNAYFFFQLIQVFLVRTITDTASTAIVQIVNNPSAVFNILATALPTSSNFYISYFIVQGFTIATGVLTQVVGCVIFELMYKYLTSTPRGMYNKWTTLSAIMWGNVLPVYTTIAVISITYAVIAPLMLFWSTLALGLFYTAYRYNILFVSDTQVDTRGLFYPRALKQLFSGIYLSEVCMVGMFAISKAPGPAVLMGIFLVFTILFHLTLMRSLGDHLRGLPVTLQVDEAARQNGDEVNGDSNGYSKEAAASGDTGGTTKTAKKGNFITRFLAPWKYADYQSLRGMMPADNSDMVRYSPETEVNAYYPPSVTADVPTLWIPSDPAGVSKQEVALSSKVIPITDEGCTMDEKNKLHWDAEGARPPIWEEKTYY